jgi:hypothetical protein
MKLLIIQFPGLSFHFILLPPPLLGTLFSNTLSLRSLRAIDQC